MEMKCDLIQDLVDKATPKKPIQKIIEVYTGEIPSEQEIHYYCPVCEDWVGEEGAKNNYCPDCGQKLDWSEENE